VSEKRCVVCDELYDADEYVRCPTCFPDSARPEPAEEPIASVDAQDEEPPAPSRFRTWLDTQYGIELQVSPRAERVRFWTSRVALVSLAFCVSLEVWAVLGFVLHVPVNAFEVVLAALTAAAVAYFAADRGKGRLGEAMILVAAVALLLVASLWLAGRFYDVSFDGQAYQQEGVLRLAAGWNPTFDAEGKTLSGPHIIWNTGFPRGMAIEQAAIFKVIGVIEPAKGLTLFLTLAAFCVCLTVFAAFEGMPTLLAVLFAALAAFNPIFIQQVMSFYVDARVSALMTILIMVFLDMILRAEVDWISLGIAGLATIAACNVKFTSTVFTIVFLVAFGGVLYIRLQPLAFRRYVRSLGIAVAIGLLFVGFNPYLTNTAIHSHPLWPVYGPDAVPVAQADITPADFAQENSLVALYRSIFYLSADPITPKTSTPKLPFTIQPDEWKTFTTPDVRVGQMGPLFGGALILALLVAIAVLALGGWRDWLVGLAFVVVGIVLFSVLINPDSWWMRYNPQMWLAVVLLVSLAFLRRNPTTVRALAVVAFAVLLFDAAFVANLNWRWQFTATRTVQQQLARMKAMPQPVSVYFNLMYSNRERLKEAGIKYKVLKKAPSAPTLLNSDTQVVGL
jgi:hypothetical protein